ncbi:MAG: ATP-binding protein, partial [Anaerolineae bacterium]
SARSEGQLLRIIQEALANVRKHAHARRVKIRFELWDSVVQTTVEDSGRGFQPAEARRGRHFGLDTMRERAESVGGTLLIESKPGAGTKVVVRLPQDEKGGNDHASH